MTLSGGVFMCALWVLGGMKRLLMGCDRRWGLKSEGINLKNQSTGGLDMAKSHL